MIRSFITFYIFFCLVFPRTGYAKEQFRDGEKNWSKDKIKRYIRIKFASSGDKEIKKIIATFTAESGLRCNALNKSNDVGVAQINKIHWKRFGGKDRLKGCKQNIDAAKILYSEWGNSLRPWTAYTSGAYKKYL